MVQVVSTVSVDDYSDEIIEQIKSVIQAHRAPATIQIVTQPNASLENPIEQIFIEDMDEVGVFEEEMSEEHAAKAAGT